MSELQVVRYIVQGRWIVLWLLMRCLHSYKRCMLVILSLPNDLSQGTLCALFRSHLFLKSPFALLCSSKRQMVQCTIYLSICDTFQRNQSILHRPLLGGESLIRETKSRLNNIFAMFSRFDILNYGLPLPLPLPLSLLLSL